MKRLALAIILGLLVSPAVAQVKLPAVTGNLAKDIKTDLENTKDAGAALSKATTSAKMDLDQLWAKLQEASIKDLQYAQALATATATPGGKMRAACWGAWVTVVQNQQGVNAVDASGKPLGAAPDPKLFTSAEQLAEVSDSLQASSPFMVACQPVANALKMDIMKLVTTVVGGGATLGTFGVAL